MTTQSFEARKLALIEEITAAFDGVELEDGVSLSETYVIDDDRINDRNHEIRVQARAVDTDTRWQDVRDETIAKSLGPIWCFFDAKGYRYYIPAFVLCYLRHLRSLDDGNKQSINLDFIHSVLYVLEVGSEDELDDFYLDKFSVFSDEQSQAIAHFLEFQVAQDRKFRAKLEAEDELFIEAEMAQGEMTEEEAQEWRELSKETWLNLSYAERGLNRYWGRFLKAEDNRAHL